MDYSLAAFRFRTRPERRVTVGSSTRRSEVGVERRAESLRLVGGRAVLFDYRMNALDEEVGDRLGRVPDVDRPSPRRSSPKRSRRPELTVGPIRGGVVPPSSSNSARGAVSRSMNIEVHGNRDDLRTAKAPPTAKLGDVVAGGWSLERAP